MISNDSSSRTPVVPVLFLALAAFASAMSLRVTDALLPRFAAEFNVTLGTASNVITMFSIAYGLSQLFFGPVGDRFGKYRVIGWACLACAMTAAFCALAPSFRSLLVARLLAGCTAAAIIPLSMAWIGDVVPYNRRQPVLARFLIGQILGLSTGVLAGGVVADHFSWRAPFFFLAFLFLPIGVALLSSSRRLPAQATAMHKPQGAALPRMVAEFGQVLAQPWARVVLLSVFLEGAFLYGPFAFIALHLHRAVGVSLSTAGSLLMLFGFGGLLFATTATNFVRQLGEVGLVRWGGALITVSFLALALAPAWWWAVPACFIAGLGFYMLHNTLQIHATQMAPERRGAAVSAFAFCFFQGQSVGVAATGLLVERAGTAAAIVIGAVGVLALTFNFGRLQSKMAAVDVPRTNQS